MLRSLVCQRVQRLRVRRRSVTTPADQVHRFAREISRRLACPGALCARVPIECRGLVVLQFMGAANLIAGVRVGLYSRRDLPVGVRLWANIPTGLLLSSRECPVKDG